MKEKNKKISLAGNGIFSVCCILSVFILWGSLVFSINDSVCQVIPWTEDFENKVGISSQIITAIVSLVVSIIGIAISLQNETVFGVKTTRLYALRVNMHFPILWIIVVSILLCVFHLLFYMIGLTIACLGILVVTLIFLMLVVCSEVPIMAKQEKAILGVLKNNLIICYLKKEEASKYLKDAVKYLLYTKTLKELFEVFKDDQDQDYNQYVLFKLLEFQHDLAFEVKDNYDETEQKVISSSLLGNVMDVIFRHIDMTDEMYTQIIQKRYLLTRVLFRIYEIPGTKNKLLKQIRYFPLYLSRDLTNHREEDDLISSILIIMVANTVKDSDFDIIKAIRHELSTAYFYLEKASSTLNVFAVLSLFLYYLCESDADVPSELKQDIRNFIDEGDIIEERVRIMSWKNIFSKAAEKFDVDYDRFIWLAMSFSNEMEYYLYDNYAKFLIIQPSYLSYWYLTHVINAKHVNSHVIKSVIERYPRIKPHLQNWGNKCIDEKKNFVPTSEMKRIAKFFNDGHEPFVYFTMFEERGHMLFEFVNKIRVEELQSDSLQAAKMENSEFEKNLRESLEDSIKNEWKFDSKLEILDSSRYLSVLFEKIPEAANFEESMISFCIENIFEDLKKFVLRTVVYNDDHFENNIQKIISEKPQYITSDAKRIIPNLYIKNDILRVAFNYACDPLKEIKSKILGSMIIMLDDSFCFNCKIDKVEVRNLTDEELSKQVSKYQRADGQYVFNGAFLPQEEINKIVSQKFSVLDIEIRHRVVSSADSIYKIKPYLTNPEE